MRFEIDQLTGALLVRGGGASTDGRALVCRILPWERGLLAEVSWDGVWQPLVPEFGLLDASGEAASTRDPELQRFVRRIPEDVRGLLCGFRRRQLQLLQLAARGPWALELLRALPALAWLAADAQILRPGSLPRDFHLLRRKELLRRASAGRAGPGDLALLGKLDLELGVLAPAALDPAAPRHPGPLNYTSPPSLAPWPRRAGGERDLYAVRRALGGRTARALAEAEVVPVRDLVALLDWPTLLDYPFGLDVLEQARRLRGGVDRARRLCDDTVHLCTALGLHPARELSRVRTLRSVRLLHDRLVAELGRSEDLEHAAQLEFPAPPLAGLSPSGGDRDLLLEPITDGPALLAEGKLMEHCVGSYGDRVARGHVYVYRVLAPERATLSIVRSGHLWVLDQLHTFANGRPARSTRELVERWLERGQRAAARGA